MKKLIARSKLLFFYSGELVKIYVRDPGTPPKASAVITHNLHIICHNALSFSYIEVVFNGVVVSSQELYSRIGRVASSRRGFASRFAFL